jgi:hypothetical protein
VSEAIITLRQQRNPFSGDYACECIFWRRWHLFLRSSTRS